VLFQRFYRPDDMTRGTFGDSRCSVFNRTRVALHECFDQGGALFRAVRSKRSYPTKLYFVGFACQRHTPQDYIVWDTCPNGSA